MRQNSPNNLTGSGLLGRETTGLSPGSKPWIEQSTLTQHRENSMGEIIFWLNKRLSAAADGSIGPKAVSLCALRRLGLRVPRCFFVTTDAFREHVQSRRIETQIRSLLDRLEERPESTPSVLDRIRDLIAKASLVHDIEDGIATAYHQLGAATVAVRS